MAAKAPPHQDKLKDYLQKLSKLLETEHDFPGPDATQVLQYLYLGNELNAVNEDFIKPEGITHIVNCCEDDCRMAYKVPNGIKYMGFSAKDNDTYDIMQHFDAVHAFINDARKEGGKILVHCVYGSNRSGALVIAHLMIVKNFGPISAAMHVKERRGVVLTNEKFQEQVVKFAIERNLLEIGSEDQNFSKKDKEDALYIQKLEEALSNFEWPGAESKILDFLYLTGDFIAGNVKKVHKLGITHIINCVEGYTKDRRNGYYGPKIKYMGFDAEDDQSYDIMQHFAEVYDFIEDARKSKGKVLIHCLAGVNRSGVLTVAYIMIHKNIGPISAAKFVKKSRKGLLTNSNFQMQLLAFAKRKGKLSLDFPLIKKDLKLMSKT